MIIKDMLNQSFGFRRGTLLRFAIMCLSFSVTLHLASAEELDLKLKPEEREGVKSVFDEMAVIQRRAMKKAGRFLFSTYGSFDFSDGPYTMYGLNLNPGYAVSDFFEVYANLIPAFVTSEREIVSKVRSIPTAAGTRATIVAPRAKWGYGVDFIYAPLYGKDALGNSSLLRSDTFFRFNVSQIRFENDFGWRFALGLGKTFFLGKSFGLRPTINVGYLQTIIDGNKKFRVMSLVDAGAVFYF